MDADLLARMGLRIRRARMALAWRQVDVAEASGLSQSTMSRMELGRGGRVPLETWARVAATLGLDLHVDLMPPAAGLDDPVRLRCHRLVVAKALTGGWAAWTIADETVLERPDRREAAIVHVWDVIGDVDAAVRNLERRLAAELTERGPGWRVSGFVVIVSDGPNRRRLSESGGTMNRAFPARGARWLIALGGGPMPDGAGMLWTSAGMQRLRPFLAYFDHRLRHRDRLNRCRRRRTSPARPAA